MVIRLEYCPAPPQWAIPELPEILIRIRQLTASALLLSHGPLVRLVARICLLLSWPMQSLYWTVRMNSKYGQSVKERTGKSRRMQAWQQLCMSIRFFIPATHYYRHGVFLEGESWRSASMLGRSEAARLFQCLNSKGKVEIAANKLEFGRWCQKNELPCVPTIAVVSKREVLGDFSQLDDHESCFVKPQFGARGEGASIWRRTRSGAFANDRDDSEPEHQRRQLLSVGDVQPVLVQPNLTPHSRLLGYTNGALPTVRIVTGKFPCGAVEYVSAILRMPVGKMITDNLGLFSPVIGETGAIGAARTFHPFGSSLARHPDTGKAFDDLLLPDWSGIQSIALAAHQRLEGYVFLAWDIACTDEGTVLLETNENWDVLSIQKAHQCSLIETPFTPIVEAWLDS